MTVPRSRPVTGAARPLPLPLVAAAFLAVTTLLVACEASTGLTAAGLPADGPTRTPGGSPLEPPSAAGSPGPARTRSAAGLLQAARAAFAAAPSVHVTGTVVKAAQGYELDLRLKGADGATARIVPSTSAPGPSPHPEVRVIRIGEVAWVGGNLGFWRSVTGDEAQARRRVGSWVKVPADGGNFGEYVTFTRPETLTALLPDAAQPATVESPVPFEGRLAVPVVVNRTTRLTVAAEGAPYPLQVSGLTPDESVSRFLNFSEYGTPVPLRAPDTGDVEAGTGTGS
jgi:hypothetical protein